MFFNKKPEDPKKKKKKIKKRTKFTIFAVVNIFWYTVVVLILSFFDKIVPPELTGGWFAAWTVELALLYGIKVKCPDGSDAVSDPNKFSDTSGDTEDSHADNVDKDFVVEPQSEEEVDTYDSELG